MGHAAKTLTRRTASGLAAIVFALAITASAQQAAAQFGIEFSIGPPAGTDGVFALPNETFSVIFRYKHGGYGCFDLDGNTHIDLQDFAVFQAFFIG